ncbi:TauD/TfdA family dioxygenase [Kutzneria buriramensis]|nr:TauD/TfdA family dioxygenase [Kutzneria buriramensis]
MMTIAHIDPGTPPADVRAEAESLLAQDGAVLLRGFDIADADAFHRAVTCFGAPPLDSYRGGNTPRSSISTGVFTSTEYPARYEITLHNEMSYARQYPRRLFFGCLTPAESGGATPVCSGRALLADLPAPVRDRFAELGVVYHQHLHGGAGLGKSWQDTFETDDKSVVDEFLTGADARFEWTADGGLRVRQHRPGVLTHPDTGHAVWFNQADQWHPATLPDGEGDDLLSIVDGPEDLPHWVTYGDGSHIPAADLAAVRAAGDRNKLAVPWRRGDLMIVDNLAALHGRQPFTGSRKVVVSMT